MLEGFKIEIQTTRESSRIRDWYLLKKGTHRGPFSHRELLSQIEKDEIKGHDRVWRPGLNNWIQIGDLTDFDPTPPPIPIVEEKIEIKAPVEEEVEPEVKSSPLKYGLLLIPFIIIGLLYYYLTIPPKRYLPFARLNQAEAQRLNNLAKDINFKGELTLSQDGKENMACYRKRRGPQSRASSRFHRRRNTK